MTVPVSSRLRPASTPASALVAILSLAAAVSAPAAVDFAKDVGAVLKARCVECHGPAKQKAGLRLDTKADFFKGAKGGVVVKAGDAAGSSIYQRVVLPAGNDERMPPEGDPLSAAEIEALKTWINEGAAWPEGVTLVASAAPAPAPASETAPSPLPPRPAVPAPDRPKDFQPPASEAAAIAALARKGVEVRPVAQGVPWREVNLRLLGTNATDALVAPLKEVPSLIDVRLGTTLVTDAGLDALAGLPHLEVLGLERTGVTDAGLARLKPLHNLVSLNLYGTAVSDAGLEALAGMKHLRNLYLWQTRVTPEGVKKLQECLPGLDINTGADLVTPSTNAPAAKPDEAKK